MRKTVYEIQGAIDWIDDPSRGIGQLYRFALAAFLFTDESVTYWYLWVKLVKIEVFMGQIGKKKM